MSSYKCLQQQEFVLGNYKIVPIRLEDRFEILQWRNEQINILRQKESLTTEKQDWYFENVVKNLFDEQQPTQLLFSFLEDSTLIGYGGLVHIDWQSKNAEISFLLESKRNANSLYFRSLFCIFLDLIIKIGFGELNFIKLHTTCYKIEERKGYIEIIELNEFVLEGELKYHIKINNKLVSVLIYSLFNQETLA